MEHIFGEMYQVPEKIRPPYLKIKILELLLYLDAVSIPEKETERPYFYRTQVEKVKAVRQFLMDHMEENFTQEELSRRFDFPLTPMKNCFRSAYGSSIGAWLTTYRMNQAAELLLKDRERTISEIGCQVGYDSERRPDPRRRGRPHSRKRHPRRTHPRKRPLPPFHRDPRESGRVEDCRRVTIGDGVFWLIFEAENSVFYWMVFGKIKIKFA